MEYKEKCEDAPKMLIITNSIRCNLCQHRIESIHRHDFVTCKCGNCSVDGGTDYLRRVGKDYTELSETVEK